ncbi:MAG: glycosyltransferase family 2 protein [Candidatus Gracilibacteria bacterium]|jgi:GT2 family glycosyltransferase
MDKMTAIVINYNSGTDMVKRCVDSILNQTIAAEKSQNLDLIFIDNNSKDREGLDFVREHFAGDPRVTIIGNTINFGYAKAANQGIKMAVGRGAKYVSIVNPDVIFEPDYFKEAIKCFEKDGKIAAVSGKILKYDLRNEKPTNIIDSTGLFIFRNRRVIDLGQGTEDKGQFETAKEVFGVSGSCPLYRVSALEDAKVMDEYFDEDFFMYKEDIDLSWRFLLYGWKNYYCPSAIAYHVRGTGIYPRFTTREIIKLRKHLSKFQKFYSFRNQNLMEKKNGLWGNFFSDFFSIILKKIMLIPYLLFFEPHLIKAYFSSLKTLPHTLKKRKIIMKNKKVSAKEMSVWFKANA